jgi:rubrerythrin
MSKEKQIEKMGRIVARVQYLGGLEKKVAILLYDEGCRFPNNGEWKKVNDKSPRFKCTICNHLYNNKEYKYCPFCGAKMKGGAE